MQEFTLDCKHVGEVSPEDLMADPRHFALPDEAPTSEPGPKPLFTGSSKEQSRYTRRKKAEEVLGGESNVTSLSADWTLPELGHIFLDTSPCIACREGRRERRMSC